jgi:tetratricopeptide (TPR) repeat protein
MSQPHLSSDLLARFSRGAGSQDENLEALHHLSSGCADCRSAVAGAVDLRQAGTEAEASTDLDRAMIARIVASDLLGADEAMGRAETLLQQGTGDPLQEARLFEMETNLRCAQRRFPEALSASKRAEARYALIEDRHKVGSVLIERAAVLTKMDDHAQTEALLLRSLELLDAQRDERLPLMVKAQLALSFNAVGRFTEARQMLSGLAAAFAHLGDNLSTLRVHWLEANAAAGLQESLRAEALLCEVRSGFTTAEIPYDVALVSLDLAVLYLEQGRIEEVKAIARDIASVFLALQIRRETYAAALLFQRAVETETVTLVLAKRFAQYLRAAQSNPRLVFGA